MPIRKEKAARPFPVTGPFAYIPEGDLRKLCRPITSIKLLEGNPRINDDAAEQLSQLIKENGFRKAIVIDQNGIIRAGNTAYKAARYHLQMAAIPCTQSEWLTEADALTYVVSDNASSEWALWDKEILRDLTKEHELDRTHRAGLGLSDSQLKKLFEVKKEQELAHKLEVSVTCASEDDARELYDHLTGEGYKCRVLAL